VWCVVAGVVVLVGGVGGGGGAWCCWKRAGAEGLALGVKYVTQFTAFRFGCSWEALYSYMCCQGDLVKEM